MQISVVNGSIEYDGTPVLTEVYFDVHDKEKIALVGRNGCGKTSLLRALTGELQFVKGTGEENLGFYMMGKPTLGYLKQVAFSDNKVSLFDEVISAYGDLLELEKKLAEALKKMEADSNESTVKSYSDLHDRYENAGGYSYVKECTTAIRKFGFSEADMKKPLDEFSGGQRTKIALLKLLLSRPDVLLLDEPTNHLDIEAVEWLENYLKSYKNSCVIVSHDRMFLDRIVNVVYEIEYGEAKRYRGNYTAFVEQKRAAYEKALKDATAKVKEIERLQKIVERFRYKANKAAMAQAKLAQIKRIGTVNEPERFDTRTFRASFQPAVETVKKTLILDKLSFGYDKVFGTLSFILEKGEKLGVIGANGCGKSTFIKTLMGRIPPLDGSFSFGLHSEIGYFDQTMTQSMSENTVLEEFHSEFPSMTDTDARKALGAFLLCGEDVFKRVCDLSGGEKVRFALCRILRHKPNILILDEPTNHMDIVGKETIETMLQNYEGTVIVVSHDRYLIDKICNKLIAFGVNGAKYYECGYTEYEKMISATENMEIAPKIVEKKQKEKYVSAEKEKAKRLHRISVIEKKIMDAEDEIAELNKRINSPEVCSDYKKIIELQQQIEGVNATLEPLYSEWEELSGQ